MSYQFKTNIGLLAITPHPKLRGTFHLWLGSFNLGVYPSAAKAAESVANGKTRCSAVDEKLVVRPSKLEEWEHVE